jgi:hypothetical protein
MIPCKILGMTELLFLNDNGHFKKCNSHLKKSVMHALEGRHFTLVEMLTLLYYTFFKHPAHTPNKQGPGFYESVYNLTSFWD